MSKQDLEFKSEAYLQEAFNKALYDLGKTKKNILQTKFEDWPAFQKKVFDNYTTLLKKHKEQKGEELPDVTKYKFKINEVNESNRQLAKSIRNNIYQTVRKEYPELIPEGDLPNSHSLLRSSINKTVRNLFDVKKPSISEKRKAKEEVEKKETFEVESRKQKEDLNTRVKNLQAQLHTLGIDLTEEDNDLGVPFYLFLQTRLSQEMAKLKKENPEIAKLQEKLHKLGIYLTEKNNDMELPFDVFLETRLLEAEQKKGKTIEEEEGPNIPKTSEVSVYPEGIRQRRPAEAPKKKEPVSMNGLFGTQAQKQEFLEKQKNKVVDAALLELQRHNATIEELALNQARAQQENRERAQGEARNIQRASERAVRQAERAREGVAVVTAGQERQDSRLFDIKRTGESIKENTLHIIKVTDETLAISRRIDSGVDEIKRLQRLFAADRKGFFKAILDNELIMAVVFFMVHTNFPWTASSFQGVYYSVRLAQRSVESMKRLTQGKVSFSIGGIVGEVTPLAFSYFMLYYNKQLVEYRINKDPKYVAAFGTTFEDYLSEFSKAPMTYYKKYAEAGAALVMPTKEQIIEFLNDRAMKPILQALNVFTENMGEPSVLAEIILKYLSGQLVVVVNGVTYTIGVQQSWFQIKVLSSSLMYVLYEIFKRFMEIIGRNILYIISAGVCTLSNAASGIYLIGKAFPNYESCMASLAGKMKLEGGGGKSDLPDYSFLEDEFKKLYLSSPSQFNYYIEFARFEYNVTKLLFMYSQEMGTPLGNEYKKIVSLELQLGSYLYEFQQYPSLGFVPYEDAFYWKPPVAGYLKSNTYFLLEDGKNKMKLDGGSRKTRRSIYRRKRTRKSTR